RVPGDRGGDDNLQVTSGSPTVDAGDPRSDYLAEPAPNGGRVNLGYTGNTSQALTSAAQLVQVLSPNGLEKLQVGQPVTVSWRSSGLTAIQTVALINAGGGAVDNWLANVYQTSAINNNAISSSVDTSGVVNAAPQAVYQTYVQADY